MKKPWKLPPGSQGCAGAGREYVRSRKRRSQGGRLLLALVTLCNLALSVLLAVIRRQEILHAVRAPEGEGAQVLLVEKKETKTGKNS